MRTLVRWSDSSLSMTTPRPEKAEPSRCITRSFLHCVFGLGVEIAIVNRLEARCLHAEEFEPSLHRNAFRRRFRPHVAVGMQAKLTDAGLVDPADAGDERKPFGKSRTVGLDIDD